MPDTEIKLTREILLKTRDVIQAAHDYVELFGFNISELGPQMTPRVSPFARSSKVTRDDLAKIAARKFDELSKDTDAIECCFIGAARLGAGVDPGDYIIRTDYGDGEELTLALQFIDREAEKALADLNLDDEDMEHVRVRLAEHLEENEADEPGRKAEGIGFGLQSIGRQHDGREHALGTFRLVLTDIHQQLEKLPE